MSDWGGKRKGAGRPKGTIKDEHNERPRRQLRAFDDEYAVIKKFMYIVRDIGAKQAEALLQTNK